jgi:UDP-glucuronate decarboxylase
MGNDSSSKSVRTLVTGGAGFVGSRLCEWLLQRNREVICVDDFRTGVRENIAGFLAHPRFRLAEHDVTEPISIEADEIYHLACPASPAAYAGDPVGTTRSCVLGAMNVLELARVRDAPVLQASTSEVYGDPLEHPQEETYVGNVNPVGPRACYTEAKRCAETLFRDYRRQYGVDTKIVRIFNTYGPNMRGPDGRVVSNFVVQALSGDPITVYGDGTQTRSFCYVDDLVRGLLSAMDAGPELSGPLNLGNPREHSIRELADLVIALTDTRSTLTFRRLPAEDPKRRMPDISHARDLLAWEPRVSLEEGLRHTISAFARRIAGSAVP